METAEKIIKDWTAIAEGHRQLGYMQGINAVTKKALETMGTILDLADLRTKVPGDYSKGEARGMMEAVKMMRDSIKEFSDMKMAEMEVEANDAKENR